MKCRNLNDFTWLHFHTLATSRCAATLCLGVVCDFQTPPTLSGGIATQLLGVMTVQIAVLRTCQGSHLSGIWEGTQTVLHGVFLEPRWMADSFTASQSPRLPCCEVINQTVPGHWSLPQCARGLESEPRRLANQTSDELLWLCDDRLPPSH